ncbi:MAG: TolC family protein [Cyclobacteriaceae bacterium]
MRLFLAAILIPFSLFANAQGDTIHLTLDECIQTALDNNIALQQAENNALIAKADRKQAMMSFLPDLQAAWNYNLLFGTFWDNVAASRVSKQFSSNPNISSNLTVFSGLQQQHNRRSADLTYEAARENINSAKLDTKTNVLSAYLATILDKENIKISEKRLTLLEAQLEREVKRESVGVGNLETVYNFRSQVANERLSLTNLRNQLRSDMLTLVQLLQLDPSASYAIAETESSEEDLLERLTPYDEVLEESFVVSPTIKGAEATHEASVYAFKSSKSALMPTVSLYGEIGSRYSSQGAANPETLNAEKAPYITQMDWNQYKFVGAFVNIPIFTKFQTSSNIQRSKLNMLNAELGAKQAEQDLTNSVQRVYLDLVLSQESYRTAEENLTALEQSFEFVKKRYETGNTDFYTYLESLNNKNRAEIELVNAKYGIVFRKKILNLYRGI